MTGAQSQAADDSRFKIICGEQKVGAVHWGLLGAHNSANALAAIAAARHAGVPPALAIEALAAFRNMKRRLQVRGTINGITVYDDFAHHPTAITSTLAGLRGRVGAARIIALLEPRSNTMRLGVHKDHLAPSLAAADQVLLYQPDDLGWDLHGVSAALGTKAQVHATIESLLTAVLQMARHGDHVLIMSNGAFGGIHDKFLAALTAQFPDNA